MFEETRGEPMPRTGTGPIPDREGQVLERAGLTGARVAALDGDDRLVAARQQALDVAALADETDSLQAHRLLTRADELVHEFESEHGLTLEAAKAGALDLAAAAAGQLDRLLSSRKVLRGLCDGSLAGDERDRLLRLAGSAAAAQALADRLERTASQLPFSPLSAREAASRLERARACVEEVRAAAGTAFETSQEVERIGRVAEGRVGTLPLSLDGFEAVTAELASDATAAKEAVREHRQAIAAAGRAVERVEAALAGKRIRVAS